MSFLMAGSSFVALNMRQSTRLHQTFDRAPQMAVTMEETLQEYLRDPRWVPVDEYEQKPMKMERGMLVERGRVVMRVFCP